MSGGWELVGGEWGYEIDTPEGIIGLSANAEQAKLIAAAPRLAAALKGLLDNPVPVESWDESVEEHNKRWDRNAAAITEARAALREAGIK